MESSLPKNERRKEPRAHVEKHGKLFCDHFSFILDCQIDNQSEHGMSILVTLDPAEEIPNQLSVLDRGTGKLVDANLVWREGGKVGIQFSGKMTDLDRIPGANIRRLSIIGARRQ